MNYYLLQNGQKLGPYSEEQIRAFLKQGLVSAKDQVWAEGWSRWVPIESVPVLGPGLRDSTVPTTAPHHNGLQGAQIPIVPLVGNKRDDTGINMKVSIPLWMIVLAFVVIGVTVRIDRAMNQQTAYDDGYKAGSRAQYDHDVAEVQQNTNDATILTALTILASQNNNN